MNTDLLQQAIDHITQDTVVLGRAQVYNEHSGLCCALGEMAKVAGMSMADLASGADHPYDFVREKYRMNQKHTDVIWNANDASTYNGLGNKPGVLQALNKLLESAKKEAV